MTEEKAQRVFKISQNVTIIGASAGLLLIVLGLTLHITALSTGILIIAISLVNGNIDIIRLYPKHSEFKLALARSRFFIKNTDIVNVEWKGKKLILSINEEGKTYDKKIPLNALSSDDRKIVAEHFDNIIRNENINNE